jgi:hypothetical protein
VGQAAVGELARTMGPAVRAVVRAQASVAMERA